MRYSRTLSYWIVGLAAAGLCLPPQWALAAGETVLRDHLRTDATTIRDVELKPGGLLVGRLLDASGRPVAKAPVSVLAGERCIARTDTDKSGVFAVIGLRGGVHQVRAANTGGVYRLWAADTAPPQAPTSVELVSDETVIRGQWGPPPGNGLLKQAKVMATNPFIIGGVIAAAVAIPLALSDDDNGPQS
jgi:hypothetical protein